MDNEHAYLSYQFRDTAESVDTFDELPLWSAPFGLLLLKHIKLHHGMTVVDAGSGTGFPLLELAARLGSSCKLYGIDPWTNANDRAKQKIRNYGLHNVEIMEGSAVQIPLDNNSVDLVVSNLGINNFDEPEAVFNECYRILKPGGRLALTTNLNGHWQEFYNIFEDVLATVDDELVRKLKDHQAHRGSVQTISELFTQSSFKVTRHVTETSEMRFLDGTAFLNHHFI